MTAIRVAEEGLADEVARHKAERLKAELQGVLIKYATLHDTVTASAFDVVRPPLPSR
jgi:hypothetical protein